MNFLLIVLGVMFGGIMVAVVWLGTPPSSKPSPWAWPPVPDEHPEPSEPQKTGERRILEAIQFILQLMGGLACVIIVYVILWLLGMGSPTWYSPPRWLW